jgi:predicted nucleic acid-binding protein
MYPQFLAMPVAIDTSVLVEAERQGGIAAMVPPEEDGPFYIPALAAAEFLVGTHPPTREDLRRRARLIYQNEFKHIVSNFTEADAMQLAALSAELKRKGQTMKFFDAAIAASVLARGDKLLTADSDYERLGSRITLLKI